MVKETRCDLKAPFTQKKKQHLFLKFAVSCLLVGLAIHLFLTDSFSFSSVLHNPSPLPNAILQSSLVSFPSPPPHSVAVDFLRNQNQTEIKVECDIFVGDWVADPSGPMYTNESCLVIQAHQNCMRNGRPDSGYLYWRWKPRGCELPKFNPKKFLHLMRDKSWAFIGDSISRNQVQSLLCILTQVEVADEVYRDEENRSKIWKFPSYNFTLSVIWSPFLVKADISEDINGVSSSEVQLYLDILDDKWTNQYNTFDYMVIAGGKWFLKTAIYHEKNTVTGCHNCHANKNLTEIGFDHAYRKALQRVYEIMTESEHKAVVLFRTTTPEHFENGEWFNGGNCNRTVPFKEDQINVTYVDSIMRNIEVQEFEKAKVSNNNFKLLDTTGLSLLRPDGHPGPYRHFQPLPNSNVQNDCLHWCLPGPIDTWNDLVLQMVSN